MAELVAALAEKGIRLRSYQPGEQYSTCPACSAQRKPQNQKKQCLGVKIEENKALYRCNHCEWHGAVFVNGAAPNGEWHEPAVKPAKQPPPNPQHHPKLFGFFEKRRISRETIEDMGIYFDRAFFPQTGKQEPCIVFPYRLNGQVVNNKYRSPSKEFRQDAGAMKALYNVDSLADNDECVFVEGEIDVLSVIEAGYPSVVSLPDGAPAQPKDEVDRSDKRYAAIENCAEQLAPIKKFTLAVDNDGPGDNLAHQLALRLGLPRCFRPKWPDGCKDPNDVLMKHGPDELRRCIDNAAGYPVKGLREIAPGTLIDFRNAPQIRTYGTGIGGLDRKVLWRPGQLVVVVGVPGHGKTSLLQWLSVNFSRAHDWRWAICSTEHDWRETVANLAENKVGLPFRSYGLMDTAMSDEMLSDAETWVAKHYSLIVQDDEDQLLTLEFVLRMARTAHIRHGIKGLIIDPWNDLSHEYSGERFTDYVNQALRRLKLFARNHDLIVFLVVHPPKMYADKQGKRAPPTMYDVEGSAHFYNRCDIGFTIWRPNVEATEVDLHFHKIKRKDQGSPCTIRLDWERRSGQYRPILGPEDDERML